VIGLAGVTTTTAAIGGLLLMIHRTATKKGQSQFHGKPGVNRGQKAIAYGYCCCCGG
jgi:hypothetical protein